MGLPPAPDTPSGRRYRKSPSFLFSRLLFTTSQTLSTVMEAFGVSLETVHENIDAPRQDASMRDALFDCSQVCGPLLCSSGPHRF